MWPPYILVNKHHGVEEYYDVDGIRVSDPKHVRSLCETLSNPGNVRELKMDFVSELKNIGPLFFKSFPSLEILYLIFATISIEDVVAILDTYCQALWSLELEDFSEFYLGPDQNIILSKPTALRELSIHSNGFPLFTYSLISQSPDLTRLRLAAFDTTDEVTRCFGEKLEHLDICVTGKLPRIGCMNLKSLYLSIIEDREEDIFEGREDIFDHDAGDLSNIRCLTISTEGCQLIQNQAISVMWSYNIGRNLEGLTLFSEYEPVSIYGGHICSQAPILRTLTLVYKSYVSDSELLLESMPYETIRELEVRGGNVTVTTGRRFAQRTCNTCKEVHLGGIEYKSLPLTSYLDGARGLN
jgi:hypothetical protein